MPTFKKLVFVLSIFFSISAFGSQYDSIPINEDSRSDTVPSTRSRFSFAKLPWKKGMQKAVPRLAVFAFCAGSASYLSSHVQNLNETRLEYDNLNNIITYADAECNGALMQRFSYAGEVCSEQAWNLAFAKYATYAGIATEIPFAISGLVWPGTSLVFNILLSKGLFSGAASMMACNSRWVTNRMGANGHQPLIRYKDLPEDAKLKIQEINDKENFCFKTIPYSIAGFFDIVLLAYFSASSDTSSSSTSSTCSRRNLRAFEASDERLKNIFDWLNTYEDQLKEDEVDRLIDFMNSMQISNITDVLN